MGRRLKATPDANVTKTKPAEVQVTRLAHPKVWALAIKLANGNKDNITVESYSKVWVTM